MVRDYENIDDIDSLTDDELTDLARERLEQTTEIDTEAVEIAANAGRIELRGRVGTEGELQRIEHVLTDVLGIDRVTNDLVVDPLVRDLQPDAADTANIERNDDVRTAMSGGDDRTTDSAEHLLPDQAAEQFGTHDAREAVERGYSYDPPDGPIQTGTESRERH
jgi:hypothetical protein